MAYMARNPDQVKEAIATPPFQPQGVSGLDRDTSGYIHDEWLDDLRGHQKFRRFREMEENDAVCASGYYQISTWMQQTPKNFNPADDSPQSLQAKQLTEESFEDMSHTWEDMVSEFASAITYGYSLMEAVLKLRRGWEEKSPEFHSKHNDGMVGFRKIERRHQETIYRWQYSEGGYGPDVVAAYQQAPPKFAEEAIALNRCGHFRTRYNKGSPEGRSLFRGAYRSWYFLKRIQEYEAIGISKDMNGVPLGRMPLKYFDSTATDDEKATLRRFTDNLSAFQRNQFEGMVWPAAEENGVKTGFDLTLMSGSTRKPMDTDPVIRRLESRVAIAFLSDTSLLGLQGNVGSWALAEVKQRMSTLAINALLANLASVINNQIIPILMSANGIPMVYAPTLEFGEIDVGDALATLPAIAAAIQAGALTPGPKMEEHLLNRLGIPQEEEISPGQLQDAIGEFSEKPADVQEVESETLLQQQVPVPGDEKEYLTVDEIVERFPVSRNVVHRAIDRGQIQGVKIGRTRLISRSQFQSFLGGGGEKNQAS